MDRRSKLLDTILNPEIKLHRIVLPQQHSCKVEDVLADQQLCNQKKNSILDQEEPNHQELCSNPEDLSQQHNCMEEEVQANQQLCSQEGNSSLVREEPEPPRVEQKVLCTSQEGDQDVLNEETDPSKVTAADENNHIEPEPSSDMALSHNCPPRKKSLKCKRCGKSFSSQSNLNRHRRIHIGMKPFTCKTCGKCFSQKSNLTVHIRTHTGEKRFSCKTCGKQFNNSSHVIRHMKTHTDKKQYVCKAGEPSVRKKSLVR